MLHSLENFDASAAQLALTPRSLEACRSLGIEPSELLVKQPASSLPPSLQQQAQQHLERRRQSKLDECLRRRWQIMEGWSLFDGFSSRTPDEQTTVTATDTAPTDPDSERERKLREKQLRHLQAQLLAELKMHGKAARAEYRMERAEMLAEQAAERRRAQAEQSAMSRFLREQEAASPWQPSEASEQRRFSRMLDEARFERAQQHREMEEQRRCAIRSIVSDVVVQA